MPLRFLPLVLAVTVVTISGLTGCDSKRGITTYTIPTTLPVELAAERTRMLAAMVPQGEQVWFFKVTGPESAISLIDQSFREFVESIEFTEGEPSLDGLPDGWRRGGERMMRFATIDVDTPEKQLDISISKLSRQDDYDAMVAMNVNRWRKQVGLEESESKWAEAEPLEVASADGPAVWVDIEGDSNDTGSMSPPFAGGAAPFANRSGMPPFANAGVPPQDASPNSPVATPKVDRKPAEPSPSEGKSKTANADDPVTYETPDGWRPSRGSSMRLASFKMGREDAEAELTVIPAGGDLRGNVARWMGQVLGESPAEDAVDAALDAGSKIDVDGRPAQRFFLPGKDADNGDAIDATIVPLDDNTNGAGFSLFIKMTGPAGTVKEQAESITQFLKSLKVNL